MKKTKLNLGCYDRKIPDFTNVDIREEVNPDLLDNVFTLSKVKNNTVDLIYACHVLERAHKNGWDFNKLKEDLTAVGFTDVQRYDWRKTEHFYIDDYSQTYYPHMDKEHGKLMSLNVEAKKK